MKFEFLCMCNHHHANHEVKEAGGFNVCQIEDCGCKCYDHFSPEKVQRLLNHMTKLMTSVDISRMEWQGYLDMAKMAAEGLLLELWTNDDPPKKITTETIKQAVGRPINIMQRWGGKWKQVGTGVLESDGVFSADITSDETMDMLTRGVISGVSLRNDPPIEPSPYETLVATPGSGVVEIPRVNLLESEGSLSSQIRYDWPALAPRIKYEDLMDLPQTKRSIKGLFPDLDDHPFFKETPND